MMQRVEQSTGRVVLLNGPPSCGKTTLARALRRVVREPSFHLSLDDFRRGYDNEVWQHDDGRLFERVMRGYLGALRALALAGSNVIAEAVVTPDRLDLYLATFQDVSVVFVAVRCPLEVAVARESGRTDRLTGPVDLPADAFNAVHSHGVYDIEVDTSAHSADEIAIALATNLADTVPSAFDQLRVSRHT